MAHKLFIAEEGEREGEEMKNHMSVKSSTHLLNGAKHFLAVVLLQFGQAGMAILVKFALNMGMSHYTFVVYRHATAAALFSPLAIILERKVRPNMTISIFAKIMLLGLLEPVIDQNLFYFGMKHTTAAFASTMSNILPALTFLMACIFRLEKVNLRRRHGQAKVVGTIATVGGAMLMTLIKGRELEMPWTRGRKYQQESETATNQQDPVMGALVMTAGCLSWAGFVILQAITLKSYPAGLSLTAMICVMGTLEGTILTLAMEWGNKAIWFIHFDAKLLAAVYSGIVCSGVAYYVQGMIMKERGPVFVTAFGPLSMIIVTIAGSFILHEQIYLGRVIGSIVIVTGLYLVIWGKSKDQLQSKSSDQDAPTATMNGNGIETSSHARRVAPADASV